VKIDKTATKILGKLFFAYFIAGSVYYLSGYLYNMSIGKQNVFSPFVGLPLTLLGWPQMLVADFIHREVLGIKPPLVLTCLTLLLMVGVFTYTTIRQAKQKRRR